MSSSRKNGNDAATMLALGAVLTIAGCLVALTALVVPSLLALPLILFGFLFVGSFHYVAWGWWMSRRPPVEPGDEE